jgi:hypothetical protein
VRAICLASVVLLAGACGGETAQGLEITRADGSRIDVPGGVRAWCGPTRGEATDELSGPPGLYLLGGAFPTADDERPQSFWSFVRRVEHVERESRTTLPEQETSGAVLFVLDGPQGNELSSADDEEASGTIEVEEWGCDRGDAVRLSVEATLGSELFQEPTVRVEGTVETEIGEPPPGWD